MKYAICLLVLLTPRTGVTEPNKLSTQTPVELPNKRVDKPLKDSQIKVVDDKITVLYRKLVALRESLKTVCENMQDGQAPSKK